MGGAEDAQGEVVRGGEEQYRYPGTILCGTILCDSKAQDFGLERRRIDEHDFSRVAELGDEHDPYALLVRSFDEPRLEFRLVADEIDVRRLEEDKGIAVGEGVAPCGSCVRKRVERREEGRTEGVGTCWCDMRPFESLLRHTEPVFAREVLEDVV